jgi:tetratricopeptide (TPR) repeat protein
MRLLPIVIALVLCSPLAADDLEKTQRKEFEAQVKVMTAEAQRLEKAGKLVEARAKYAESQSLIEVKDITEAIKHLDDEIQNRVKSNLAASRKLYEAHDYKQAAASLEEGLKLEAYQPVLAYNLALCYHHLGEREKALEYLNRAKTGTADPKQKQKLLQSITFFTTKEDALSLKDAEKDRVGRVNTLAESIGVDASLEDSLGEDSLEDAEVFAAADSPASVEVTDAALKTTSPTPTKPIRAGNTSAGHRASLCTALGELKSTLAATPSGAFDLANCAEINGRDAEAVKLLEKYLEMSPEALDRKEIHARIADLKSLLALPGQKGIEVRRVYASLYGSLAERRYDRSLADLSKAAALDADFTLTEWRLALLYEAFGNVPKAKEHFAHFEQLTPEQSAKDEAALHLSTLDAKRTKYDEEVDEAQEIISELFNRAMNLTFNGLENRSALKAKRARTKKKDDAKKAGNRIGGFAIPYAYAQQQLSRAAEHLQIALALFPLGAEANELMGLVFLQANDGRMAIRNFDVVASQGLPVSFYAELRDRKHDQAVKCELNRDHVRLIYLSSYDKRGKVAPPSKPAGEDGLGDLVVEPFTTRQQDFDALDLKLGDIKKLETNNGQLRMRLPNQDVLLSPIFLPTFLPVIGPQGRRFANNYTRLFVRYPGLEDAKLGTEGMSGGEKFQMGMSIANASMGMAMGGFTGIGAIGSIQDAVSITRTIRSAMISLNVSFATWEKSVEDQQELLSGKSFKSIPTQPMNLAFVQDAK